MDNAAYEWNFDRNPRGLPQSKCLLLWDDGTVGVGFFDGSRWGDSNQKINPYAVSPFLIQPIAWAIINIPNHDSAERREGE